MTINDLRIGDIVFFEGIDFKYKAILHQAPPFHYNNYIEVRIVESNYPGTEVDKHYNIGVKFIDNEKTLLYKQLKDRNIGSDKAVDILDI